MTTPSGWYSDALKTRPDDHDQMHVAVAEWLLDAPMPPILQERPRSPRFEYAIVDGRGRILAFADLAEVFPGAPLRLGGDYSKTAALILYEIKPRIESIGGIARQCEALELAALRSMSSSRNSDRDALVIVFAVVPSTDPKRKQLDKFVPTLGWNGSELEGDRFSWWLKQGGET